jgi:hypothetical protein
VLAGAALADGATLDRLARELRSAVRDLAEAAGLTYEGLPPKADDARRAADLEDDRPLLWWDDRAAEHMETFGKAGRDAAKETRSEARDRWQAVHAQLTLDGEPEWGRLWALWWAPGGGKGLCPILLRLTSVLWLARWRAEVEAERIASLRVSIIRQTTFDDLIPALSAAAEIKAGDRQRGVVMHSGSVVGWFDPLVLDSLTADKALDRLRSPAGIALLCMGAEAVARNLAREPGHPGEALVTAFPAKRTMAKRLGLKVGEFDDLLSACRAYRAKLSDGRDLDGMFTSGRIPPAPGRPGGMVLGWNPVLFAVAPGSWLTPLPDPDTTPRFGPRLQQRAALAWLLVHRDLSERAAELARDDMAPVDWTKVADQAELTRKQGEAVREVLLTGQGGDPWMLEPAANLYRLADERRHGFLVKQGERRAFKVAGGIERAAKAQRAAGKFAKGRKG